METHRLLRHDPFPPLWPPEILIGIHILREALNTDLVCDAINTAMRELFLQIVYGRSPVRLLRGRPVEGASSGRDLGKGLRSQVGTMFA